MAATDEATALRVLAIATFRAATFVVALALYLHLTGSLSESLRSLNTELGFAAFSLFWATTLIATRAELRRMPDGELSVIATVMSTTVAGAWNGVYVWLAILVPLIANAMSGSLGGALVLALVGSVMGGMVAFTVGALFGLVYGVVDAVLRRTGAVIVRGLPNAAAHLTASPRDVA